MLYYINIDVHKICLSRYGAISNLKLSNVMVLLTTSWKRASSNVDSRFRSCSSISCKTCLPFTLKWNLSSWHSLSQASSAGENGIELCVWRRLNPCFLIEWAANTWRTIMSSRCIRDMQRGRMARHYEERTGFLKRRCRRCRWQLSHSSCMRHI